VALDTALFLGACSEAGVVSAVRGVFFDARLAASDFAVPSVAEGLVLGPAFEVCPLGLGVP
jgi:hypothetical protein